MPDPSSAASPGSGEAAPVSLQDVREAAARLQGRVHRTPLLGSSTFSGLASAQVYFKAENLQKTGSFKVRGAFQHILRLPPERCAAGVVTVSAGNHAAAVAYAAASAGIPARVVMMQGASPVKLEATRAYGAALEIVPDAIQGFARAHQHEAESHAYFVHPFDHRWTVEGTGSVGLEVVEDLPDVDVVIAGVGGGGLLSGLALAVKELRPRARVYGVEPEGAAGLTRALEAGQVVRLEQLSTIADGLAAPFVGELNLSLCRRYVDGVVTVTDDEIVSALRLLLERSKLLVEPAGAAALAALLSGKIPDSHGRKIAVILSGGNIGPQTLTDLLGRKPQAANGDSGLSYPLNPCSAE